MRRVIALLFVLSLSIALGFAQGTRPDIVGVHRIDGMHFAGRITRDSNGVVQILAFNRHDLYFLNGYAHAHDRLFQMDYNRRLASGTLAELVGAPALSTDVQLRTIGLRRAAETSHAAYSERSRNILQAYADGVNAYLNANPTLPPEYAALEITRIASWTSVDTVAIGKLLAFGLSFDAEDLEATIALRTYQGVGQVAGFNGTALFFEDLWRTAPFDRASTVPDARGSSSFDFEAQMAIEPSWIQSAARAVDELDPAVIEMARQYLRELRESQFFQRFLPDMDQGSNEWGIAGRHSTNGRSMMANDPHLDFTTPSQFHPLVLRAGRINVAGHSFPGAPGIILGHNARIAWGATVSNLDATDFYQEQVVADPTASALAGLSVVINGQREWLFPILQQYRQNNIGDRTNDNITDVPPTASTRATLIVTRRNAPIISLDPASGLAISVQYVGLGPTRELETFLLWAEAENLDDFREALQLFDVGSQNFSYVDIEGNIAHFTSGEIPIREDLQAGTVSGAPPFIVRNGTGGNDWIRLTNPPPTHATTSQILPFEEMPQIVNPPTGWFVNANNDPAGTTLDNNALNQQRPGGGIFYVGHWYANGIRAGRVTQMIRNELQGGGKISFDEMKAMQGDVVLLDAQFFVPFIIQALRNAQASGAPAPLNQFAAIPAVVSAVGRLEQWDFSTPTGIPEGYDASDAGGNLSEPSPQEIERSIAATIYSTWRGRFIANTIDPVIAQFNQQVPSGFPGPPSGLVLAALRNLLENLSTRGGVGVSGVPFFNVPPIPNTLATATLRRDTLILKSMSDALALLASDTFAAAFNRSTDQNDYRWGRLHRVVFRHPLGEPFNIPPAGGAFTHPLGAVLPGIPTDGGYEVVDASHHNLRAGNPAQFTYGAGPARRFVAEGQADRINAETSLPGGPSGIVGNPLYFSLLKPWLTNDYYPSVLLRGPNLPFVRD